MKFATVSLAWVFQVMLSARMEFESARMEVDFSVNSSQRQPANCNREPAASDAKSRCKNPKESIWETLLCKECNDYGWFGKSDDHPVCQIICCDPNTGVNHDMCLCTHYGNGYNPGHPWYMDYGNTADKCCGRDVHGVGATISGERCGCGHTGMELHYGGQASDCCSGEKDHNGWCIQRSCTKKGESGKCCRISTDNDPSNIQSSDKCPCFHGGEALNPNDIVGYENCCSGSESAAGGTCGCIADPTAELPDGADERDCCSGEIHNGHCKASECSQVGEEIQGGEVCCSGKTNEKKDKCICVVSGEAAPKDARDCCSGRKSTDEKTCDYLLKGELVGNATDAKSVCLSQDKDIDNTCRCIQEGSTSTDASQCCSGAHDGDGEKCGCIRVGGNLEYGATESDCCSKSVSGSGICRCAAPGAPLPREGKAAEDCCAKRTGDNNTFCGCFGPKDSHIPADSSGQCCGGAYNYDGSGCTCVKKGFSVGGFVHQEACCGGTKEDGICQ